MNSTSSEKKKMQAECDTHKYTYAEKIWGKENRTSCWWRLTTMPFVCLLNMCDVIVILCCVYVWISLSFFSLSCIMLCFAHFDCDLNCFVLSSPSNAHRRGASLYKYVESDFFSVAVTLSLIHLMFSRWARHVLNYLFAMLSPFAVLLLYRINLNCVPMHKANRFLYLLFTSSIKGFRSWFTAYTQQLH